MMVLRSTAMNSACRTFWSSSAGCPSPNFCPSLVRAPGLTASAKKRRPGASFTLMSGAFSSEADWAGVRLGLPATKETSPLRRAATAASWSL